MATLLHVQALWHALLLLVQHLLLGLAEVRLRAEDNTAGCTIMSTLATV